MTIIGKIGPDNEVVIPESIRDELGIGPGDMVEIHVRPVSDADEIHEPLGPETQQAIAEGLDDLENGRAYGPFDSASELVHFLKTHPNDPKQDITQ